ncbi:hypothetical protein BDV32DRAFT_131675 [Aspergillus pseudonomiae]|nr:hypothetical protein BDV32DRAFT_131675 [Aspergillus pseudonomiae]
MRHRRWPLIKVLPWLWTATTIQLNSVLCGCRDATCSVSAIKLLTDRSSVDQPRSSSSMGHGESYPDREKHSRVGSLGCYNYRWKHPLFRVPSSMEFDIGRRPSLQNPVSYTVCHR